MASFRLINNTSSVLPLSDSSFIGPGSERIVAQLTLELRRLELKRLLTIIPLPDTDELEALLPDYVGTSNPNEGVVAPPTGGSNDLGGLAPAPDGSVPEFSTADNLWHATTAPRKLVLDGGNF